MCEAKDSVERANGDGKGAPQGGLKTPLQRHSMAPHDVKNRKLQERTSPEALGCEDSRSFDDEVRASERCT